jgi:hypothetical protein
MPVGPFWDVKYEADVLPENADPTWSTGAQTGSGSLVAGGLNIITTTGEAQEYLREVGNLVPANVKRVEIDITVNSSGGTTNFPSHVLRIADGVADLHVMCTETGIVLLDLSSSIVTAFTGDMTILRTVRVEVDNTNGALIYVDGNLEHTQPYNDILSSGSNELMFGDYALSVENFTADTVWGKLYYNLDVGANPGGPDWSTDGDFVSQEVTITGPYTADDSYNFYPQMTTLVQKDAWDLANLVRIDRIDDTTIKFVVVNENDQAFDYEFHIIKNDAGIT